MPTEVLECELVPGTKTTSDERFKPWQFKPGNPGRPRGSHHESILLSTALKKVQQHRAELKEPCLCTTRYHQKDPCKTLDEHFVRLSFFDPFILAAVQKKRIPDLMHQTGTGTPSLVNVLSLPPPKVVDA